MSKLWRADTDVQPLLSKYDVLNYAAKYTTREEAKLLTFDAILSNILAIEVQSTDAANTVIRKLLMTSVAERNYLAQETCHLFMGFSMYHSNREFVSVTI